MPCSQADYPSPQVKAAKSAPKPRLLAGGISKDSRSASYHRRGLWAIKKKHGGKFPTHEKTVKKAEAAKKEPRFYPAEDVKKPLASRKIKNQTKLRCGHNMQILTKICLFSKRVLGSCVHLEPFAHAQTKAHAGKLRSL